VILPLPRRRGRWVTRAGLGIAAVAVADLGLYAFLLAQQTGPLGLEGRPAGSRVFFVGGFLVLLAVLGLIGALVRGTTARTLICGFTAGGGLALGCALDRRPRSGGGAHRGPMITGTSAAFVVLLIGIATTT